MVNDELVSRLRSWRRASVHHIKVGERKLEVRVSVTDMVRGVVEVQVHEAGELIRHARLSFVPDEVSTLQYFVGESQPNWKFLLACMVIGLLLGMGAGYFGWW